MKLKNMSNSEILKLAGNSNTSIEILRNLAKNDDFEVRGAIAGHQNTPEDILEDLAKDDFSWVRYRVAKNSNTPINVLWNLAKDEDWGVMQAVVENPQSCSNLLIMLFDYVRHSKKPQMGVIRSLYCNKKLPYIAKIIMESLYGEERLKKWI